MFSFKTVFFCSSCLRWCRSSPWCFQHLWSRRRASAGGGSDGSWYARQISRISPHQPAWLHQPSSGGQRGILRQGEPLAPWTTAASEPSRCPRQSHAGEERMSDARWPSLPSQFSSPGIQSPPQQEPCSSSPFVSLAYSAGLCQLYIYIYIMCIGSKHCFRHTKCLRVGEREDLKDVWRLWLCFKGKITTCIIVSIYLLNFFFPARVKAYISFSGGYSCCCRVSV